MAAWLDVRPDGSIKEDALEWLRDQGISDALADKLWPLLVKIWTDAYDLGQQAAVNATGYNGNLNQLTLQTLISSYGPQWLTQIVGTLLSQIAAVLAAGGSSAAITAGIAAVLANLASAKRIAQTEITRAAGEAALMVYRAARVPKVIWVVDPLSDVCVLCEDNAAAGPRFLGTPFPSGADAPPQHVRCRCALLPYRS